MPDDLTLLAIISTVVFLLLAVFIVSFALVFQRRQVDNMREQTALKAAFEEEILKAQVEVQNQTLQHVSEELHDNIGQLLSVTKLYLNQLEDLTEIGEIHDLTQTTNDIVEQAISGVRALTRSLDGDFVREFGLVKMLTYEVERMQKSRRLRFALQINGDGNSLGFEREIVLFRMVQEVLNNAIKHAQATEVLIAITYQSDMMLLSIDDDGRGFDYDMAMSRPAGVSGAGLRNVQRRAKLVGGTCTYQTAPGQGTKIQFILPLRSIAS